MAIIKPGDTLVVTKLDRIAGSATEGSRLVGDLLDRNIGVHVLNMGKMDNTPTGKLVFQIMFAFAEFERDMIVERTQEGRAIARRQPNFKEGRPKKFSRKQIEHALELLHDHSYSQVTELTGISKATLARAKTKENSFHSIVNLQHIRDWGLPLPVPSQSCCVCAGPRKSLSVPDCILPQGCRGRRCIDG